MIRKIVSEMTYNVSSETLNRYSTVPDVPSGKPKMFLFGSHYFHYFFESIYEIDNRCHLCMAFVTRT